MISGSFAAKYCKREKNEGDARKKYNFQAELFHDSGISHPNSGVLSEY